MTGNIVTMPPGNFRMESLILLIKEVSKSLDLSEKNFIQCIIYKEITV